MASNVPLFAVRPDDQSSADITTRDFADNPAGAIANIANGVLPSSPSKLLSNVLGSVPAIPGASTAIMAPKSSATSSASRIPSLLQFPLACLIRFGVSFLLYSLVADWVGFELAAVSRDVTERWQIAAVVGWKVSELGLGWIAGYDWQDVTSLACLSHLPYYFLLYVFYKIDLYVVGVAFGIDILSIALPFILLRGLIRARGPAGEQKSANQEVAQDGGIFYLVASYGIVIYATTIYASLYTWLPVYLVRNFQDVRSMEMAHTATVPLLVPLFVPIGVATAHFLFAPAIGSRGNPGITDPRLKPEVAGFDAETATFAQTLAYNLGFGGQGLSKRAEILANRTVVLVGSSFVNNFVRIFFTVEGTTVGGALGYASMWAVAGAATGLAYSWAANE